MKFETNVLYKIKVGEAKVSVGENGYSFPVSDFISNGRASYMFFESLVRSLFGLEKARRDGSDHLDPSTGKYLEQKSFKYSSSKTRKGVFQTSASNTFGANNRGSLIKKLLLEGKYQEALNICRETGYDKNDFYVYTNTGGFVPGGVLEIIFLKTEDVMKALSDTDPRKIDVKDIYSLVKEELVLDYIPESGSNCRK